MGVYSLHSEARPVFTYRVWLAECLFLCNIRSLHVITTLCHVQYWWCGFNMCKQFCRPFFPTCVSLSTLPHTHCCCVDHMHVHVCTHSLTHSHSHSTSLTHFHSHILLYSLTLFLPSLSLSFLQAVARGAAGDAS